MQNESTPGQNLTQSNTTSNTFTVKVKLLTNEVFEIETIPEILVIDFKKLVAQKTKVPVERQRLVFMGKQLVDNRLLKQHIKQSGLTVHLIAKAQPQQSQPPTANTSSQNVPHSHNNPTNVSPQNPPPPPPPFPIFNPLQALFGPITGPPDQSFANTINNAIGSLVGNIRIVPPPNINPPQPQQAPQQPQPPTNQQNQQNQPPTNQQTNQPRPPVHHINIVVNNNPLNQLQSNINRLNLPEEQLLTNTADGRQLTAQFLRRLQQQMLRFIPQLNRGIQLLQEGRVTHLADFIPILTSFNQSNSVAIEALQRLLHQYNNQNAEQSRPNIPQPNNPTNQNNQSNQNNQAPQPNTGQPNFVNIIGGFLQPGSGSQFNFANLFAPQRSSPTHNQQPSHSNSSELNQRQANLRQSQSSPQPQSSQSQPIINQTPVIQSSPNPYQPQNAETQQPRQEQQSVRPQQQVNQSQQQSTRSQQQVAQSPQSSQLPQPAQSNANLLNQMGSGGLNIMDMFSNLQQSGGMGQVLGTSLGDMLQQQGAPVTVYSSILKPITGSEFLGCFTQKNFSFFNQKRAAFRECFLKAISLAGSRQNLVQKYSQDIHKLIVPTQRLRNQQLCNKRVSKILSRRVQNIIEAFLDSPQTVNLTQTVPNLLKGLLCESLFEISKHTESIQFVFANMKANTVRELDRLVPGLSGLFYGIVQRDLYRIYREFIEEEKRRREQSQEEAKDEADLLQKIQEQSSRDLEYLTTFEHSKYYTGKSEP